MALLAELKQRAHHLKAETFALYLAARDPRTPWYAKLLVAGIVAYAVSPIDLIPDFVPVLGYLDDLILIPAGIALAWFAPGLYLLPYGLGWFVSALLLAVGACHQSLSTGTKYSLLSSSFNEFRVTGHVTCFRSS